MRLKIRLPQCKIRFAVFIVYNMFYVFYMKGYTSQIFYFGTLMLFCGMNAFILIRRHGKAVKGTREFRLGTGYIAFFFVVSAFFQCIHLDFKFYLITGLIRILLPVVNAYLFVNTIDKRDHKYFFNVLLARYVVHFIWQNYNYLNLNGLLSISWSESNSEMESSLAHDFLIMEMYYLYRGEKKKSILCMILCMLSMKRLSFILAPVFFVTSRYVPKGIEVKKIFCTLLKATAIVSPIFILLLYSQELQAWLISTLHIDLNAVMSGRPRIYQIMLDNMPYYNGYGSINNFLEHYVMRQYGTTWNAILHNDFLRIFYETTIVGVIILTNNLVEIAKKEYWFFFMMTYLIMVAITSHILNYLSVWITFYMIVMSHSRKKDRKRECCK